MTSTVEAAPYTVEEVCERFDPVMGLEVHVELNTATKMFCGCRNEFGAEPNTHVCPVCLGLPGSLPRVNARAVESAVVIGLALDCQVRERSGFSRKNYFYPDMPKNFQISQYEDPIVFDGHLDVPLDDGTTWRVEIERAHMEEDTGKSLHMGGATGRIHGADYSLLDYNRAGVPLIEIVTKPIEGAGVRAPEVARAYVVGAARRHQGSRRLRRAHGPGLDALRRERLAEAEGRDGVRHPHRDEERQLAALGRAGGALRDGPARGRAALRRHDHPGDAALRRAVRDHLARPREGDPRRLPLLPRARPRADRAVGGVGGEAARGAAGAAVGAARAHPDRLGPLRRGAAGPGQRGRARPRRRHRRRRCARGVRALVVGVLPGPAGQHVRASRCPSSRSPRRTSRG